jgi:hypothetical protein
MSDPLRLHALSEHTALIGTELVDDPDRAELAVITPEDLADHRRDRPAVLALPRTRPRTILRSTLQQKRC